jgi:hypothetical protein
VGFDADAAGWRGGDRLEHWREGGVRGGYVTATRAGGLSPFATGPNDPKLSTVAGDWPAIVGGDTAAISWHSRTPRAGTVVVEIFAAETQWSCRVPQGGTDWEAHRVTLHYDWTDAEAAAAGWTRSPSAFSWRDTIRHVGRVAFGFSAAERGDGQSLDLDEVEVRGN